MHEDSPVVEKTLPYGIVTAAVKFKEDRTLPRKKTPELKAVEKELQEKTKELQTELEKKGLDRIPKKIERLRKEVQELKEKIYGKHEDKEPVNPALKEKLEEKKEEKLEEQRQKIKEKREKGDVLKVVYKVKEKGKGDLEELKKELAEEEAKVGGSRIPKKIERLKKEIAELEKGAEDKVEDSVATRSHVSLIEDAIEHHRIMARIQFSANYDNKTILKKGGPDPEKVGPEFKYKKYTATFSGEKSGKTRGGRWTKSVEYEFNHDLTDEGKFDGKTDSTLLLDGKTVHGKDKLKVSLDDYVKENMVPEGLLPWGQAVSEGKTRENVKFPAKYYNTKLEKKYPNVKSFHRYYQGLFTEDLSQKKRKELLKEKHQKREVGRQTEDEVLGIIKSLENEIIKAEGSERKEFQKDLEKMKKILKELQEFPIQEESLKTMINTTERLIRKREEKLSKVSGELGDENAKSFDDRDQDEIRRLTRRKKNLTESLQEDRSNIDIYKQQLQSFSKKSFIISLADHLRTINAVSKEWLDVSRALEKAEDGLTWYKKMLKTEKDSKAKEKMQERVNKIQKQIDELKTKKEKTEGAPTAFPPTSDEKVKKLYDIFDDALKLKKKQDDKHKPSPFFRKVKGWLTPVDYAEVAKNIQATLREKYRVKIDDVKDQKGTSPEERESEVRKFNKQHAAELKEALEYMTALPADLKKRRDEFKKSDDYGRLKDPEWLDNESKIEEVLKKVKKELAAVKETPKSDRQKTVNILEMNKFKGLEDFLDTGLEGLDVLVGRFEKAALERPVKRDSDIEQFAATQIEKNKANIESAMKNYKDLKKEVESQAEKDPDLEKALEKAEAKFRVVALRDVAYYKNKAKEVPALFMGSVLLGSLQDFSSLYNYYSSILWFGRKEHLPSKSAEEAVKEEEEDKSFTKDDVEDLTRIRKTIIRDVDHLTGLPMNNDKEMKSYIKKVKKGLDLFIDGYSDYPVPTAPVRQAPKTQQERGRGVAPEQMGDPRQRKFREEIIKGLTEEERDERDVQKKKRLTDEIQELKNMNRLEDEIRENPEKKGLKKEFEEISLKVEELSDLRRKEKEKGKEEKEKTEKKLKEEKELQRGEKEKEEKQRREEVMEKIPEEKRPKKSFIPYEIVMALTEEGREKAEQGKFLTPDMKGKIEKLLKKSEEKDDDQAKTFAKEYAEVKEKAKKMYQSSLEPGFLKTMLGVLEKAKGEKLDKDESETFFSVTGKVVDAYNRSLFNNLVNRMMDFVEKGEDTKKRKQDSRYFNRTKPEDYKEMIDWVEGEVSNLTEGTTEEPEPEAPGKPTPPDLREHYEKAFKDMEIPVTSETFTQMKKIFQKEIELPEGGGGGKGPKTRPKPKKIDPPKGTFEILKENLVKKIEGSSTGSGVITEIMGNRAQQLKKMSKVAPLDKMKAVDGMVFLLKNTMMLMKSLQIGPAAAAQRVAPGKPKFKGESGKSGKPGAPEFTGRPDIVIEDEKSANALYKKMHSMINAVNEYIEPDEFAMPPQTPAFGDKKITLFVEKGKDPRYVMPYGLMHFYNKPEAGAYKAPPTPTRPDKKSSAYSLAFKLAQKFAFSENQSINEKTEEDLITIDSE